MRRPRLSFEEFKILFQNEFQSEETLRKEYEDFSSVFEPLDQSTVPGLSPHEKVEIFEAAWQRHRHRPTWRSAWFGLIKQPVVTFALGLVLGCFVMTNYPKEPAGDVLSSPDEQMLSVEQRGNTRIFTGKIIERIYPQVENPQIVLETKEGSPAARRVLYGTFDDGEISVVWNM